MSQRWRNLAEGRAACGRLSAAQWLSVLWWVWAAQQWWIEVADRQMNGAVPADSFHSPGQLLSVHDDAARSGNGEGHHVLLFGRTDVGSLVEWGPPVSYDAQARKSRQRNWAEFAAVSGQARAWLARETDHCYQSPIWHHQFEPVALAWGCLAEG
jgi:hypothetical protein